MIYCSVPLFSSVLDVSDISELNLRINLFVFSINYAHICRVKVYVVLE